MINCPNCGAPLISHFRCEYCGTHFHNSIDDIDVDFENEIVLYADNVPFERYFINPALNVSAPHLPLKQTR